MDWLDLDGKGQPGAKEELQGQLQNSPEVQREHDAYQSIWSQLRAEGQAEKVPMDRLREHFRAKSPSRSPSRKFVMGLGIAVAASTTILLLRAQGVSQPVAPPVDSMHFAEGIALASAPITDPSLASDWVLATAKFDAPRVQVGNLERVECGPGWACYGLMLNGEKVRVYLKPGKHCEFVSKNARKLPCGTQVYCCEGTGWESAGYSFYIVGSTEEKRSELVSLFNAQTKGWVPRKPADLLR